VSGPRGMTVSDHVIGVDGCQVGSVAEWINCIRHSMENTQHGYCLSLDVLQQQDVSVRCKSDMHLILCESDMSL